MRLTTFTSLLVLWFISMSGPGFCQDPAPQETPAKTPAETLLQQLLGIDASDKQVILEATLDEDAKQIHAVFAHVKDRTLIGGDLKQKNELLQQDVAARSALHGLVMLAAAPGHEAQRLALARVFAELVSSTHPEGVERFLTRMVGELGDPIGVAALASSILADENWSDESIRSLGSIPGEAAQEALIEILKDGPTRWRPAAATALGARGETEGVVAVLLRSLEANDPATTEASLDALAGLGAPEAMKPMVDRLLAAPETHKGRDADRILELAEQMEDSRYEAYCINLLDALLLTRGVPENRREMARKIRQRCVSWKSLFDGLSAKGWIGQTDGYRFSGGEIRCEAGNGGNIYTKDEYADFIFRFEFKLWPGSNNGLGLRAPSSGNTAYQGMEAQILDDGADKYANLKPYQFHGSIYGVIPAVRGHQLPVGEWNFQEVRCDGRRITITLNGHVIVDADLDVASRDGTLDGQAHPGLKRSSGHIGFLGHGDAVAFRNLRVRSLSGE
jgi:HEAT repeat protein